MPSNNGNGEMRVLRGELLEVHRELNKLRTQNEQLIDSNKDLSHMLMQTEKRASGSLKLIVAYRQLVSSDDRSAALRAIEEILINVIGTENFVVLLLTDNDVMRVVGGMGSILDKTTTRHATYEEIESEARRMVPLFIDDNVVGAIAIQELLPHREALDVSDEQILQLLSKHAATAIMCADQARFWTRVQFGEVA
jgi:transcriptional regulator with GAF, ATPase, and Fis domain